ncbi:UNVERIFIED_CONTAM: hypothetical protein O8I53_10255 [Campylobacter lari]
MLNYKTKTLKFDFSNDLLKKYKSQILMEAMTQKSKINSDNIAKLALSKYLDEQRPKLFKEIETEYPKSLILQAVLHLDEENEQSFKGSLNMSFYPFEDLKNIDLNEAKIDLEFMSPPAEYTDKIYNKMVSNYILFKEIKDDEAKLNDLVEFNADIYQKETLIKQEKGAQVSVVKRETFSINESLLGIKVNETKIINAPDGTV